VYVKQEVHIVVGDYIKLQVAQFRYLLSIVQSEKEI